MFPVRFISGKISLCKFSRKKSQIWKTFVTLLVQSPHHHPDNQQKQQKHPSMFASSLLQNGYVVIPSKAFNNPGLKKELLDEASNFQEFKQNTEKKVMGGFAALGNPSSFHNPVVRKFRQWAHSIVVDAVFRDVVNTFDSPRDWKLDHIIDRMVIRFPGDRPSRESWHRDEASSLIASDDDKVFGGWVNLDNSPQHFSCVPGSHRPNSTKHRGFSKISKETACLIKKRNLSRSVVVPPGCILVFYENIVHEVVSKALSYTMVRLFTAFRLTRCKEIRPANLMEKIDKQDVIMIKSGQLPAMHAVLHIVNWVEKLSLWSRECVNERCLVTKTYNSGKRKGETWTVCTQVMKSLTEYDFGLYAPYTINEKLMYTPRRTWRVLSPGCENTYVTVSL